MKRIVDLAVAVVVGVPGSQVSGRRPGPTELAHAGRRRRTERAGLHTPLPQVVLASLGAQLAGRAVGAGAAEAGVGQVVVGGEVAVVVDAVAGLGREGAGAVGVAVVAERRRRRRAVVLAAGDVDVAGGRIVAIGLVTRHAVVAVEAAGRRRTARGR